MDADADAEQEQEEEQMAAALAGMHVRGGAAAPTVSATTPDAERVDPLPPPVPAPAPGSAPPGVRGKRMLWCADGTDGSMLVLS